MLFYLYSNIVSKNNGTDSSLYTITENYYTEYAINYDLSQRQKDIILAGGLLNYTKESF